MRVKALVIAGALLGATSAPLVAQLRSSRPQQPVVNLPRLMVANPFSFSPQDSSAAVRIGAGLRDKVENVADRWYKTITRAQMNEALQQYAYPVDALLPGLVARQLATSLNARAMVIASVRKGEGNRYLVEARLTGINDDAGQMVSVTQAANQSFEEFGARVGDSLGPAFRALPDAKQCDNLRSSNPAKARDAALKALKTLPGSGLAHYCLAMMAITAKAPVDTIINHLKIAAQGDRLSLPVLTQLAVQYQAKGDSTATVATFKEMLRVAPTNEPLRKEAFRLFLQYGQPEAAEQVADEGLQIDPANADIWDLKSSACLFQDKPEKNKCAIDALEQVFALDTTKADTTFFTKITFAASRPSGMGRVTIDSTIRVPADSAGTRIMRDSVIHITRDVQVVDTARFLKWSRAAIAKYPNNAVLIGQLAEAYSLAGPVDSAVSVTKRLMAVDSSDVTPVLRVVQKLTDAKRGRDALALTPYIERLGGPEDKSNLGAILARGAFPYLQPPPDYALAADMARQVLKLVPANSTSAQIGNFVLGLATFQTVVGMDQEATATKSCPMAQQMKTLLEEAGPALQAGRPINEALVSRYLQGVDPFMAHVNSMIKVYCK